MSTSLTQPSLATLSLPLPGEDLTIKQKSFADLWLQHRNGRLAAKLAGYDGDDATLSVVASENLRKPKIREYIDSVVRERHLSSDQVLAELADVAAFSLDSIAVEGSPVRTSDKVKALELYGKFHKLFTEKVEVETDLTQLAPELSSLILAHCERIRAERAAQAEVKVIDVTPVESGD